MFFYKCSCSQKHKREKKILGDNKFHNILRLFDALSSFPCTTNDAMGDYTSIYDYTNIRVGSRVSKRLKT